MYRFLIVKKYKIIFWNVISSVVEQCIRVSAAWRIAKICLGTRNMFVNPGPKCVVVNFVYSNHV